MAAELNNIPAWAERERWNDLAWIASNLPSFWSAAIEELVVILLKEQQRTSAYRVRAGLRGQE